MTPRTVVIPGNGTDSLSFTIPAGVDFNVESVVASVDAAAAGDTIGELAVAEVTGAVIATKRQGLPIPAGSSGTETWALRLDDEAAAAAAAGGYPFAASGINGPYAVASGVTTQFGLDAGDVFGDGADSGLFTVDATGGIFGLGVHARGFYAAKWMVQYTDRPATPVANPQNFTAEAEDGSGSMIVALPFLGSIFGRGYLDLVGNATWDVSWWSLFAIHSTTGANPIVITGNQATGQPLDANTQMFVFQLSTDTFGF